MVTHNHLYNFSPGCMIFFGICGQDIHLIHRHTCRQDANIKIKQTSSVLQRQVLSSDWFTSSCLNVFLKTIVTFEIEENLFCSDHLTFYIKIILFPLVLETWILFLNLGFLGEDFFLFLLPGGLYTWKERLLWGARTVITRRMSTQSPWCFGFLFWAYIFCGWLSLEGSSLFFVLPK